jgi:hypothetical protein
MFRDTNYISLGISPNADAFVMQPFISDGLPWPCVVYTGSIAELDSRGRAEAVDIIACLTLCFMKTTFPVINVFADSLIPGMRFEPLAFNPGGDRSGSKRTLHLRIHAINEDRSIVIRRFNNDDASGNDTHRVLLEPLMALGPEAVADFIGTTLLAELVALHPDVFAPFPALRTRPGKV